MTKDERKALGLMADMMRQNAANSQAMQVSLEDSKNESITQAAEAIRNEVEMLWRLHQELAPLSMPGMESVIYRLQDVSRGLERLCSYGGSKTIESLKARGQWPV